MTRAEKLVSQITPYEAGRAGDKCPQNDTFRVVSSVFAVRWALGLTVQMFYNYRAKLISPRF